MQKPGNKWKLVKLRQKKKRLSARLMGHKLDSGYRMQLENQLWEISCEIAWVTEQIDNHPEMEDGV